MTPETLAKSNTEHANQAALFAWCAMAQNFGYDAADDERCYTERGYALRQYGVYRLGEDAVPELRWFHAIPNGGARGDTRASAQIAGGMIKAEGAKAGVADTFLPVRRAAYCGLYIEMKRPQTEKQKAGIVSQLQAEFATFVQHQSYFWIDCYRWTEAVRVLRWYLSQ